MSRHAQHRDPAQARRARTGDDEATRPASGAVVAAARRGALSATSVSSLQRLVGNGVVSRMVSGAGAASGPVVQRFRIEEMKQGLGNELLHKHVGTESMPDLSTPDAREDAVGAVYYQRSKGDRRTKNTVFFVDPATLFDDLRKTHQDTELSNSPTYTTTASFPAISVLVVGKTNKDSTGASVPGAVSGPFIKFELEHGTAKPMVKINKEDGRMAFNHLQETNPKVLGTKLDLLKSED